MDAWLQAILLGVVQGLTEFLPVSSSGHLVLIQAWLGESFEFKDFAVAFDLSLHVGTLLPVLLHYRLDILRMVKSLHPSNEDKDARRMVLWIVVATIPTGLIGIFCKDLFEQLFHSPQAVALALLGTGGLLLLTRGHGIAQGKEIDLRIALIVGVAQGLAITPGISRSGTTIAVGLLLGLGRERAARFSFLLSIPAIVGAAVLVAKDGVELASGHAAAVGLGLVVSALVGYGALVFLVQLVRSGRLHLFTLYLWPLALVAYGGL